MNRNLPGMFVAACMGVFLCLPLVNAQGPEQIKLSDPNEEGGRKLMQVSKDKESSSIEADMLSAGRNMKAGTKSPIRVDADENKAAILDPVDPWPEAIRADKHKHAMKELFGGEFSVCIYETEPGILRLEDLPFDEFVHILSGSAVITDASGTVQTFNAGDSFIVPKGFSGTWEAQGEYREMFIIETESMNAGFEKMAQGG